MKIKKYFVIGNPIDHSLSPKIQNQWIKENKSEEYKKVTKQSVNLSEAGETEMMVQATSRVRNFVQATKQYKIGGVEGVAPVGQSSSEKLDANIKKFMELHSTKRPSNDKAPANPDTPKA